MLVKFSINFLLNYAIKIKKIVSSKYCDGVVVLNCEKIIEFHAFDKNV